VSSEQRSLHLPRGPPKATEYEGSTKAGEPKQDRRGQKREDIPVPKKIYVGNLPFVTTDEDLGELFAKHGKVSSAKVITDRETGRSRGFGFVEMEDATAADEAIRVVDGTEVEGRNLRVNEAKERGSGPPGR
jgi:RNA recognition motif-containing protein